MMILLSVTYISIYHCPLPYPSLFHHTTSRSSFAKQTPYKTIISPLPTSRTRNSPRFQGRSSLPGICRIGASRIGRGLPRRTFRGYQSLCYSRQACDYYAERYSVGKAYSWREELREWNFSSVWNGREWFGVEGVDLTDYGLHWWYLFSYFFNYYYVQTNVTRENMIGGCIHSFVEAISTK